MQWSAPGDRPWSSQKPSGIAPAARSRCRSRSRRSCTGAVVEVRGGSRDGGGVLKAAGGGDSPDPVQAVDVVPQGFSQSVGVDALVHGHPVVGHVAHNLQRRRSTKACSATSDGHPASVVIQNIF